MRLRDPGPSRALLAAWLLAAFWLSAVTDARVLGAASVLAIAVFHGGAGARLVRVAVWVLPLTLGATLATAAFERILGLPPAGWEPLLALNLRAALLAFLALSVLARASLLRALEPWPWASRVLVVVLAQIHALRLVATESRLGLRSRLPRRPGAREVVRGAGGITGALLVLSSRNARDAADALRSRGF